MKIYTDLTNRTRIYNIPDRIINTIYGVFPDVEFTTTISNDVEIYYGDLITKEIFLSMPNLKWVHFPSTGFDRALIPEIKSADILVTNSKNAFTNSVATTVIGYICYLIRGFRFVNTLRSENNLNRKSFDKHFDYVDDLNGLKCLIVGYGTIGKLVANVCNTLGMEIHAIKRQALVDDAIFKSYRNVYSLSALNSVVSDMDFVINLLPLTKETEGVFNIDTFISMKKTSYFINVGRGKTVIESDLIKAIDSRLIYGAALDVFETEPLPIASKLWDMDNVFITPHIANVHKKYWDTQSSLFIENLKRFKSKTELLNLVNLHRGY